VPSILKPPGADGFQLGSTFRVKDVIFCGGGVQSSAILWDKSKIVSSFFAYRKFSSFGQTEIHLIPEFVVFNGSGSFMRVKEKGGRDVSIAMNAEDIEPWIMPDRARGLKLAFQFPSIGGNTDGSIRLDEIGSKVLVVRNESGGAIGSISVQTEPGHSDSRLVIKVSALKLSGGDASDTSNDIKSEQLFTGDFFRFRARLTELQVTLKDTQKSEARRGSIYDRNKAAIESAFDIKASEEEEVELAEGNAANSASVGESDVAQIIFERFTCDFQRIFKATPKAADSHIEASGRGGIDDADAIERSQLAVILSSFQIRDCTEDARYPLIFDSSDTTASFLDLCIRLRGSFDQPLVHLECFDLNISCVGGKANTITIKTDERFLWKMLVRMQISRNERWKILVAIQKQLCAYFPFCLDLLFYHLKFVSPRFHHTSDFTPSRTFSIESLSQLLTSLAWTCTSNSTKRRESMKYRLRRWNALTSWPRGETTRHMKYHHQRSYMISPLFEYLP